VIDGELPTQQVPCDQARAFRESSELLRIFNRPAVVAKIELSRYLLWSQMRTYGACDFHRSRWRWRGGAAPYDDRKSAALFWRWAPIVIYPEGTSIPPGTTASKPVLPVCISSPNPPKRSH
jgi:1-acyl-sn-glycerol-3-phosphate acyltransferase